MGTVVLTATVVVWYVVVGDVSTNLDSTYLRFTILAITGGAVVSAGLALLVLLTSEAPPRARSGAKVAMTCTALALLLALTPFWIVRGRG